MTRLIDADALTISVLKKAMDDAFLNGNADMHRLLVQVIAHQPTIDAVPVIRCKDCKYWNGAGKFCDYEMSGLEEDYCSWAEPKEADG